MSTTLLVFAKFSKSILYTIYIDQYRKDHLSISSYFEKINNKKTCIVALH